MREERRERREGREGGRGGREKATLTYKLASVHPTVLDQTVWC